MSHYMLNVLRERAAMREQVVVDADVLERALRNSRIVLLTVSSMAAQHAVGLIDEILKTDKSEWMNTQNKSST